MKKGKEKKVWVGLSGGVDSSVSAALLKEEGYDVTGVFIKTWHPDFLPCTWKEDRLDAMRVAAHLDIPFITFDAEEEYKKDVADYMIEEYKRGRTPNPDVMCNKYVKFGAFLRFALDNGADYVATGHYSQNQESGIRNQGTTRRLLMGADTNKDQSYFLWTLTQEQLKHILFPVGHLEKPEVRRLAKKFGLSTAEKKDSQGVCFLGKLDMGEFLKHYAEPKIGDVLNEQSEVIGFHEGALLYTLGQRHGFTIMKKRAPTGARESPKTVGFRSSVVSRTNDMENSTPYFVVRKDMRSNTITVAHKEKGSLKGKGEQSLLLESVSWIAGGAPEKNKLYSSRVRYRAPLSPCKIFVENNETRVEFLEPEEPQAPGQSLVVYDGDDCLGGGVIA